MARGWSGDFPRQRLLYHLFSGKESGWRASVRLPARASVIGLEDLVRSGNSVRPVRQNSGAALPQPGIESQVISTYQNNYPVKNFPKLSDSHSKLTSALRNERELLSQKDKRQTALKG
jgi:hypothetical protein